MFLKNALRCIYIYAKMGPWSLLESKVPGRFLPNRLGGRQNFQEHLALAGVCELHCSVGVYIYTPNTRFRFDVPKFGPAHGQNPFENKAQIKVFRKRAFRIYIYVANTFAS